MPIDALCRSKLQLVFKYFQSTFIEENYSFMSFMLSTWYPSTWKFITVVHKLSNMAKIIKCGK